MTIICLGNKFNAWNKSLLVVKGAERKLFSVSVTSSNSNRTCDCPLLWSDRQFNWKPDAIHRTKYQSVEAFLFSFFFLFVCLNDLVEKKSVTHIQLLNRFSTILYGLHMHAMMTRQKVVRVKVIWCVIELDSRQSECVCTKSEIKFLIARDMEIRIDVA